MNTRVKFHFLLFLFSISCHHDENGTSPMLTTCNDTLFRTCNGNDNVPYCTFGFKFGDSSPYLPRGAGIPGPKINASQITYKFQEAGIIFKTVRQNNAVSLPLSEVDKSEIRTVILEWSSVADINFIEKSANEVTDVIITSSFIPVGGVGGGQLCALGHPAFNDEPCKRAAGILVFNPRCKPWTSSLILHEMGHVLGLGHVASENIMNQNKVDVFSKLQSGDILGIQSIYGSK